MKNGEANLAASQGSMPNGGLDRWAHHEADIGELVLADEDFIVFVRKSGQIDWETTDSYDRDVSRRVGYDQAQHESILNESAALEVIPFEGIGDTNWRRFKRLIGEAIARSLKQEYTAAKRMLAAARAFAEARSEETSRDWYLSASMWATLPFVAAAGLLWLLRHQAIQAIGSNAFWVVLCGCIGALGALFSVITRTGKLHFDCSAGRRLHNLEAGSRIVAGVISAMLTALAVQSEFILATISRTGHAYSALLMAALVAGTAERFATSIVSRLEGVADKSKPETGKRASK